MPQDTLMPAPQMITICVAREIRVITSAIVAKSSRRGRGVLFPTSTSGDDGIIVLREVLLCSLSCLPDDEGRGRFGMIHSVSGHPTIVEKFIV